MLKKDRSEELTQKFNRYYPGGHSNLRIPMDVTNHRLFIRESHGTKLVDIDGNEYIEFNGSMGPNILGHAHPEFVDRLTAYIRDNGTAIGSNLLFSPLDIEVAEKLIRYVPCAEEIKFTTSGTEAVQMAWRIMRAYTGKNIIVRVEGHYGGWSDNVLGGRRVTDPEARPEVDFASVGDPGTDPYHTEGRLPWAGKEVFMVPWNDADELERVFSKYHDEIAGIHMEGIVWNHDGLYPLPGYLERVRELCDRYGIVMCMDEVINGFRIDIGGAQAVTGVTPDICTLGKAMSNGIPAAAVVGKKKIMDTIRGGRVLVPGTFPGFGLGQCAINATLDILSRDDFAVYGKVWAVQERLMDGMVAAAERHGIPLTITESNGVFSTIFGVPGGRRRLYLDAEFDGFDKKIVETFQKYLQEFGIFIMFGGRWYVNASHSVEDVDTALVAIDRAMAAMRANDYLFVAP